MNLIVEVYPMRGDTLANYWNEITCWDVLVRPDGGDPVEDHEGLTRTEAGECVERMLAKYPGSTEDWQLEDLLR